MSFQNSKTSKNSKKMFWLVGLFAIGFLTCALASPEQEEQEEQERVYLLQLLHQMDALQSTLLAAQKEHSLADRIAFHYTAYRDMEGQKHNGVLEDLQLIRAGIDEKLSGNTVQPRVIEPIEGDYLEKGQSSRSEKVKP